MLCPLAAVTWVMVAPDQEYVVCSPPASVSAVSLPDESKER